MGKKSNVNDRLWMIKANNFANKYAESIATMCDSGSFGLR